MFGFSSRVQSGSSFEAELVAVREALKLAWDKGLRRVILESDSESVVNRIRNQKIRQPKNQLEEIILECQGYGSRAWSCFIQHTRREGNFAADALTKKLASESFELHVWNHPPESLSLILLADMIGMEVPRHGALDKNQIAQLKGLKRELLARNLHWIQSRSSFEAELVAVREALKLAWDKGLRSVIVESDSESVVDRIRNQRIRQPKNQLEEIILECQGYGCSPAWSCFFQHTYREGNFAADALTKKLVSESFELHVWNHPPKSLSLILLADMIGMDVPRHGTLDQEQTGHLKMLERGLLARNLHWC
ncbi:hypothetical protein DKX38_026577 [Salix brachista]|uniref:RNase H type-1 domain-containing protein n=1 Tax=Salix brachista TaxID=2182728 RepID=A0A5N5J9V3_9ROSI|nr:hypothetical protein DKX38_026577 [Salix brachista]